MLVKTAEWGTKNIEFCPKALALIALACPTAYENERDATDLQLQTSNC
jgi:hypothetical protein